MTFTPSQREFINVSIYAELDKQRKHVKWYQDLIEQENSVPFKNGYRQMLESHVAKLEELESLLKMINTVE